MNQKKSHLYFKIIKLLIYCETKLTRKDYIKTNTFNLYRKKLKMLEFLKRYYYTKE